MRILLSLCLLLALSLASDAQTVIGLASDSTSTSLTDRLVELEQVVVTATRTPKALKDVPVPTRLITSKDIEKVDATNVQDLLQQELPGLEFTYSMNQQTSLNMSGFGGNSVLFLVDGERLAGETLDNVDYSRLNLDNVGRIEIVKGAASTLYGSNAVGGVINIISAESNEPWALNANVRYGKFNDLRAGLTLSLSGDKVGSTTNIQRTRIDAVSLSDDSRSSISKIYPNETWNVKEKLSFRPTPDLRLIARAGFFFRERETSQVGSDRYRDYSAGLRGLWSVNSETGLELAYAFDQYDKSDYASLSDKDIRDYSNVQHTTRAILNRKFGSHTLTAGADYMRDYLMSYQFADDGSHVQHSADAFAQMDFQPSDRFSVLGGVRYDYFSAAKENSVTGKLSAMFKWDALSIRAGYAGGFRSPTLKEMYMSFDMASIFMIYGNEDLTPERSHNFSATLERSGRCDWMDYNLMLTGYLNMVSGRITTAWNEMLRGMHYVNMADLRVSGADLAFMARTSAGVGIRVCYAFVDEHIKEGEPQTSSTRPHTLTARFDYDHQWKNYGFFIALSGRMLSAVDVDEYTSVTDYTSTQRQHYPGYCIWKLNLQQRVWRGIRFNFAVDNLFNYRPDVYYGNSPSTTGTTCSVGLSVDFDKILRK
ncbi:MAG: TonB-dependent receptor [Bacteroidales bacterium]|nr:TonB-dependent receptor [Bacteroidales bacterium]